jgi:hypothetical protein
VLHPVERAADPVPAEQAGPIMIPAIGDKRIRAKAMIKEAGELTNSLRTLPPAERREVEIRIATLGSTIHELLTGMPPPVHSGDEVSVRTNGAG